VSVAENSVCALRQNGEVWCWGTNHMGQLGVEEPFRTFVPVRVERLTKVRKVVCRGNRCLALDATGRVHRWGAGRSLVHRGPFETLALEPVRDLTLSSEFACLLLVRGAVRCIGFDHLDSTRGSSGAFVPVPFSSKAVAISAVGGEACVVLDDGRVDCWLPLRPGYKEVPALFGASELIGTSCARTPQGIRCREGRKLEPDLRRVLNGNSPAALCFERDDGTPACRAGDRLVAYPEFRGARRVDAGGAAVCAVTPEGGVECLGRPEFGILGTGDAGVQALSIDGL
jgi:hypothetical protein